MAPGPYSNILESTLRGVQGMYSGCFKDHILSVPEYLYIQPSSPLVRTTCDAYSIPVEGDLTLSSNLNWRVGNQGLGPGVHNLPLSTIPIILAGSSHKSFMEFIGNLPKGYFW